MGKVTYDIFISYRRDGGDTLAQLVYDRLTDRGYKVFLDVESLRSGKFNEKLLEVIDQCKDVVVILPPGALERCRNEGDWLYLEISHALKARKNIIPVMMKGFEWTQDIPENLQELQNFNGIRDSKEYFDAVIDKMTQLMHSRASSRIAISKKARRKMPRFDAKAAARKKKKVLITAALLGAAVAAAVMIPRVQQQRQLDKAATEVTIQLTPDEEMSASEYYDAREILKERFHILAGGEKYDFEVSDETINVKMPADVFHGIDVSNVLKSYVTRPTELYVMPELDEESQETAEISVDQENEEPQFVPVSRDSIRELRVKEGTAEKIHMDRIDMEQYGIEEAEQYKYIELVLSDEMVDQIQSAYGEQDAYRLVQDAEQNLGGYCYYALIGTDEKNVFYIVDCWQEDNIYELVAYNYQHNTFARPFTFNILLPTEWERAEDAGVKGEFQCDPGEIEMPCVTVQLSTYSEEVSEGEKQDILTGMKTRLDALETPYAFGYTIDENASAPAFTIKMNTERVCSDMLELLGDYGGITVQGAFYDLMSSYDIEKVKCSQPEDGICCLDLIWDEDKHEIEEEDFEIAVKEIREFENSKVYLYISGQRIAEAEIEDALGDDRITFNAVELFGLDKEDARQKYLAQFVKAVQDTAQLMGLHGYSVAASMIEAEEGMEKELGIPSADEKREAEFTEDIQESCPEAEVLFDNDRLDVSLELEVNSSWPQQVNDTIKKVYEASGAGRGELSSLSVEVLSENGDNVFCSFSRDTYDQHGMTYWGSYHGEGIELYREAFAKIVGSDPFYTETVTASGEGWGL